jgi:hypothetical protein
MVQGSKPTYEGTRLGNAGDATEETKDVSEEGRVKKLSPPLTAVRFQAALNTATVSATNEKI